MSASHLPQLIAILLLASTAAPMHPPTPAATPAIDDTSVHVRCSLVRPGMAYPEALALMGRAPDSTLSGHTAAGPDGDPPAGSYAIDFWNGLDAEGRQCVSALHYSGGVIESVDCGVPLDDQTPPPRPPGT